MSDQIAWVSRPIGGIPVSADLGPSIIFAILYALVSLKVIYNFFFRTPRAWNVIQITTIGFALERIVWCILRALQAADPKKRTSRGIINYVQTAAALGFIGVSSELVKLLRSLVVNSTLPEMGASKDRRRARMRYRLFLTFLELAFLGGTVLGIVASIKYYSARTNQMQADGNLKKLYASSAVALALQMLLVIVSLASAYKVKEVDRKRCLELAAITLLLTPVPIYRLCVLHIRTIDILEPLSTSARAVFYIVDLLPEWICVSILLGTDVRARFKTGKWGDFELGEKSRKKRLKKAAEQAGMQLQERQGREIVSNEP